MSRFQSLCALAASPLGRIAGQAIGEGAADKISTFLADRFTDHADRLPSAIDRAHGRAWQALEFALGGEGFWRRCCGLFARAEDTAFRDRLRAFLDAVAEDQTGKLPDELRGRALAEIQTARREGLLALGPMDVRQVAHRAGRFAAYSDPTAVLAAEAAAVAEAADDLPGDRFGSLIAVLKLRPEKGSPLLAVAVRYFFRQEVANDEKLSRELTFAQLSAAAERQDAAFAALSQSVREHGVRMEEALSALAAEMAAVREAVTRIEAKLDAVLAPRKLGLRELRPADTLSITDEAERAAVRELVREFRSLPEERRRNMPTLLNRLGKARMLAGEVVEALEDFQQAADAATRAADAAAQAEAHQNAYLAALEAADHPRALTALHEAVALAPSRYAPFPMDRYRPERILGAGGFGVTFLCTNSAGRPVVVKSLRADGLQRDINAVFDEAAALESLDHPGIIRVRDCGFADPTSKSRPYLLMDFFNGGTLETLIREAGVLSPKELLPLARLLAEALRAAHAAGLLHRDVKPANVLVRREPDGSWRCKLIDFGLAMKTAATAGVGGSSVGGSGVGGSSAGAFPAVTPGGGGSSGTGSSGTGSSGTGSSGTGSSGAGSGVRLERTLMGRSLAGTMDYAAPEQLGKLPDPVGPRADVFGFGRTCWFALLGNPLPDDDEKEQLPTVWRKLLSDCTARTLAKRPADFGEVLARLAEVEAVSDRAIPAVAPVAAPKPEPAKPVAAPKPEPAKPVAAPQPAVPVAAPVPAKPADLDAEVRECLARLTDGRGTDDFINQHGPARVPAWKAAADAGSAPAAWLLGRAIYNGAGVAKDGNFAAGWHRHSAGGGFVPAMNTMGDLCWLGHGVPKDDAAAVAWYRRAAEAGLATAQYNYAHCLHRGVGGPANLPEAANWYRRAAKQSHRWAQLQLGKLLAQNQPGLPANLSEAGHWLNLAAEVGVAEASALLATLPGSSSRSTMGLLPAAPASSPSSSALKPARATVSPEERARRERIVAILTNHFRGVSSTHVAPAIPDGKLANVQSVYADLLPVGDEVLMLYDSTLFGSGKDGLVMTLTGVGSRADWTSSPTFARYEDLDETGGAGGKSQTSGNTAGAAAGAALATGLLFAPLLPVLAVGAAGAALTAWKMKLPEAVQLGLQRSLAELRPMLPARAAEPAAATP